MAKSRFQKIAAEMQNVLAVFPFVLLSNFLLGFSFAVKRQHSSLFSLGFFFCGDAPVSFCLSLGFSFAVMRLPERLDEKKRAIAEEKLKKDLPFFQELGYPKEELIALIKKLY